MDTWQVRRCVEQSAVNKYIDTSRPMIKDRSVYLAMFTRVFTQTPRDQQLHTPREHRVWRQQSTVHLEILSKATQEHRRWLLYIPISFCVLLNAECNSKQATSHAHTQVSTGLVCGFVYSLRLQGAPDCEVYSAQADRRGDGNVKETRKMKQVNATEVGTIRRVGGTAGRRMLGHVSL